MKKLFSALFIFSALFFCEATIARAQPKLNYYINREKTANPQIKNILAGLRNQKAARKWTFEPHYTNALDFDLSKVAKAKVPANFKQLVINQNEKAKLILTKLRINILTPKGTPKGPLPNSVAI